MRVSVDESAETQNSTQEESWLYQAPPEKVERAERARKELEALGATVEFRSKWWGFEVHLNQQAVDQYLEIKDLIADVLGEFLKEPLASLVAIAAIAQKLWVQAVAGGHGCKLVSPWFSPLMLIPISTRPAEDLNLWWTVFESTSGDQWSKDEKFPGHESSENPALVAFDGRLVCVHRGGKDDRLWAATFEHGKGWSRDIKIEGQSSRDGVALAVHNNRIHCVYMSSGSGKNLFHTTSYDGVNWSKPAMLPGHQTSAGPALASYNGLLHLVHRGHNNETLWHATFDNTRWSADVPLHGKGSAANPALAVYNGRLHLVHRGSGNDEKLWHASFDRTWTPSYAFPGHRSLEGPSLTVYENKLYCVHRGTGSGDENLWLTAFNGTTWTHDRKFPDHLSAAGPAAIAHRDKDGTRDQLLIVHRGYGNRAAGTDAAAVEARIAEEQRTFLIIQPETTPEAQD